MIMKPYGTGKSSGAFEEVSKIKSDIAELQNTGVDTTARAGLAEVTSQLDAIAPMTYDLIETITLTELLSALERTQTPGSAAYDYKAMIVTADLQPGLNNNIDLRVKFYVGASQYLDLYDRNGASRSRSYHAYRCELENGFWRAAIEWSAANTTYANAGTGMPYEYRMLYDVATYPNINKVRINCEQLTIGSVIKIWGCK